MPWFFDPEDPEYDPLSPFMQREEEPPMPPPVEIPDETTAELPESPPVLPSSVLPFQSLPNPSLDEYTEHISTLPQRDDYRASVARRIIASLAGLSAGYRNPAAGVEVAEQITEQPYRRAVEDWSTKGKALEAAAQQEGKTLGESVDYRLGQIKDETARANLSARMDQIRKNYEVGMKNAKTAAERAAVLKAAQEEAVRFHKDLIGVRRSEAGSSRIRAEASKTAAEAAKTRAQKSTQPKTLSSIDQVRIMRMAQDAVMAEMPEAAKFIETDDNGKIIGWKDAPKGGWFSDAGWSADDATARAKVIKRFNELREEALKELNTRSITEEPPPYFPE